MAKLYFREATWLRSQAGDAAPLSLAISSENPVRSYDDSGKPVDEILDHSAEGCDMSRAALGLPLMLSHRDHDALSQVGIVEDIALAAEDKTLRGKPRFGTAQTAKDVEADVRAGIRKGASVGYERTRELLRTPQAGGVDAVRYAWMPYSVSIVPVEADTRAGFGRSVIDPEPSVKDKPMSENATLPAPPPDNSIHITAGRDAERKRSEAIRASAARICGKHPDGVDKFRALENQFLSEGKSHEDFNAELLKAIPGTRKATFITSENLGMSRRDVADYSILRGIQSCLRRDSLTPDGLEREVHDEMCKRMSGTGVTYAGFLVPPDVNIRARPGPGMHQRDLNVTTFTQGGAFVPTLILTPIIEILRNRMVCLRLGAQSMAGLEGNVAIPRQTGPATAYSLPESATLTKSTQAIDQIMLVPHRVGAYNEYTKQLLLQSSVDVDNFIRDDLMKVLAVRWDKLILEGAGAGSEPAGILNTIGIGTVHFATAGTPLWAEVVAFETALAVANADVAAMAYVTTPTVRGNLKTLVKIAGFPNYLWETLAWPGFAGGPDYGVGTGNDGVVNGYRAAATNQIANNRLAFGVFSEAIHALWGGFDVVVNPFTRDIDAVVRITVNTFGDVAVRHAQSFCWSDNAAA